jgi:hypothetical protein
MIVIIYRHGAARTQPVFEGVSNAFVVFRVEGQGGAPPPSAIPVFRHHYVMQRAA